MHQGAGFSHVSADIDPDPAAGKSPLLQRSEGLRLSRSRTDPIHWNKRQLVVDVTRNNGKTKSQECDRYAVRTAIFGRIEPPSDGLAIRRILASVRSALNHSNIRQNGPGPRDAGFEQLRRTARLSALLQRPQSWLKAPISAIQSNHGKVKLSKRCHA